MASDTLIEAENRFGRVEIVEIGPKTGEPSRTAARSCRAICAESSRGTACAAVCHMADVERATSCDERLVETQVALRFRSAAAEGYLDGLVVGLRFTGLGRKRLGCRPVQLDCRSGLGSVKLNRGFWAGLRFGPL